MIVAVPPGGPADTLARLVGPHLSDALGQTVVIDNRPGANGNIAYDMAARAVPDGYTFVLVAAGVAINPSLYRNVQYDPIKDFAPITLGITVPNILVVHPSVPANSVQRTDRPAPRRSRAVSFSRPRAMAPPGISRWNCSAMTPGIDVRARAVQRRRAGADRNDRRAGAGAVQHRAGGDAADEGRQGARAGDHQRQALRRWRPICRPWRNPVFRVSKSSAGSAGSPRQKRRKDIVDRLNREIVRIPDAARQCRIGC